MYFAHFSQGARQFPSTDPLELLNEIQGIKHDVPRHAGVAGYRIPTGSLVEAERKVARSDSVYSDKAMAGMVDLVRNSMLRNGEAVVFLHFGGTDGVFGYNAFFAGCQGGAAPC